MAPSVLSAGGDVLVVSCGGCNYNKGSSTIDELGLHHPDDREILNDDWDGLNDRPGSRPVIQAQS